MKPISEAIKKTCIHCEREFFDRSFNSGREYCYRESCVRIEESLDENSFDINFNETDEEWN